MFEGFSQETLDFMWGIRFNNEKPWFEAHKEQYRRSLADPMKALGHQVYDAFTAQHEDLDLVCRVSRIYRDARRLHGQGMFKDHLWFSMERPVEDWMTTAVLWFELGPEGYSHGLGYYYAKPITMAKFRARLDRDPKPFEKLVRAFNKQTRFRLDGEDYKRPKGECSKLLAPWYNKKGFSLVGDGPCSGVVFTPELAELLLQDFEFLLPFYQYLSTIDSDPDPREG
ncbi:MAG: DUF2461 domain-containing protein [Pseudoflavonifractor sp.]